jgi:hypothetical protein
MLGGRRIPWRTLSVGRQKVSIVPFSRPGGEEASRENGTRNQNLLGKIVELHI